MNTLWTAAEWALLQDVVHAAAGMSRGERTVYLEEACKGQQKLRTRAESLLDALESENSGFGEAIGGAASRRLEAETAAATGTRIGPYRIVGVLGRGGMGVVYDAVRDDDQYRKRVAIKVTAAGLLSPAILQRFRNERQILANLDHPNIARLLDGGATEAGLPYVVMEYVDGRPIDEYCRERGLGLKEKLELFARVARAAQYAHQNLVVHRDLKPGNILVTAEGEPKLLDFGIAKLVDLNLESESAATMEMGSPMTPEYASPEQIRGETITTATDVYQLGVVLYELLTGERPFRAEAGKRGKLEREICERQAEKPGIDADVDRVVLKAMEKEPGRRYASAADFAGDIERYLGGFPVRARPASWRYIGGRFVKRHRLAVAAVGVAVALLLGSVIAMAALTKRANTEARTANQVTAFLVGLFESNSPANGRGDLVTARELLDKAAPKLDSALQNDPEVRVRLLDAMGAIYTQLGSYDDAKRLLEQAVNLRKNVLRREDTDLAGTLSELADLKGDRSELEEAEKLYREALRIYREKLGDNDDNVAASMANLASVLFDEGELHEAEQLNRKALEARLKTLGPDSAETLITMNNLETVVSEERRFVESEKLAREVLERRKRTLRPLHPDLGYSYANLARTLQTLGRYKEAEEDARRALGILLTAYREDHPEVQWSRLILSGILGEEGKAREAEELSKRALAELSKSAGRDSPAGAYAEDTIGSALLEEGDAREAREHFEAGLAAREKVVRPGGPVITESWLHLGASDRALGDWKLAEEETGRALAMRRTFFGNANPAVAEAEQALAEVKAGERDFTKAHELAEDALRYDRANLPMPHPLTARAEETLGWVFCNEGNAGAGIPLLEDAERADRGFYVPDATPTAEVARRLAKCGKTSRR